MTNPQISLGKRELNSHSLPYIIAEIGVNHEGSLELAKKQIELAKEGGADAAKFQTYKAETIASRNSPAYWDTRLEPTTSQYELFKKYDSFSEKEYIELALHCEKVGIDFVSTPFDLKSVDFLRPLVPYFKIASADITNLPLIKKVAETQKPIVLSTGASTLEEVEMAVGSISSFKPSIPLALLHCILNYPTKNENACLRMILGLKNFFPNHMIGYSDHTLPDSQMQTLITAYSLGAVIIEKHFTHDKSLPGNDHYHAMDARDLKNFVESARKVHALLGGSSEKKPISTEEIAIKNARRSIVTKRPIQAGHSIKEEDLICKRPGFGIAPLYWDQVLNKKVKYDLPEDHLLLWKDLADH